jgi:hypothetical protein
MWSSAMIIAPALRGLFGVTCDVPNRTIHVNPNLPVDWEHAQLHHVQFGSASVDLDFERSHGKLTIVAKTAGPESFCLTQDVNRTCNATPAASHTLVMEEPAVQIGIPTHLPQQGAETQQLKVLDEQLSAHRVLIRFEAQPQSTYDLPVRVNRPHVAVSGGDLIGGSLHLQFPDGKGYQEKSVTFTW